MKILFLLSAMRPSNYWVHFFYGKQIFVDSDAFFKPSNPFWVMLNTEHNGKNVLEWNYLESFEFLDLLGPEYQLHLFEYKMLWKLRRTACRSNVNRMLRASWTWEAIYTNFPSFGWRFHQFRLSVNFETDNEKYIWPHLKINFQFNSFNFLHQL